MEDDEMRGVQDLLDLCRLNMMEDNVKDSPAVDRDAALSAIDWKRRQVVTKLKAEQQEATWPNAD